MKKGDNVEIINPGFYYPNHDIAAKELKATKWWANSDPKKGAVGTVVNIWKNEEESLMMTVTKGKKMYMNIRNENTRVKLRNMMNKIEDGVKTETAKKAVKYTAKLLQEEIKTQASRINKKEKEKKPTAKKVKTKKAVENEVMQIVAEKRKKHIKSTKHGTGINSS